MKKFSLFLALILALCVVCACALGEEEPSTVVKDTEDPTAPDHHYGEGTSILHDDSHTPELKWTVKEPTCTEQGLERWLCTEAKGTDGNYTHIHEDFIAPLGHLWSHEVDGSDWGKVIQEPTCTEEGYAQDYCTVCGVIGLIAFPFVMRFGCHSSSRP